VADSAGSTGSGVNDAGQRVRDAAKYLVAAFGAVGAVLISGLSLSALPNGRHPFVAAVIVVLAVIAITWAIVLIIRVIVPEELTLGRLATLEQQQPEDELVRFLSENEELYGGFGTNLAELHDNYLRALRDHAAAYENYLSVVGTDAAPESDRAAALSASEIASSRAEFLDPMVGKLLDVAVFYQLKRRFRGAWPQVTLAAVVVALAAAGFAWASTKPKKQPAVTATPANCASYYLELDRLADDDHPAQYQPNIFPLDPTAKACGFTSQAQLTRFVVYLGRR